jgi:hypothetical protein
MSSGGGQNSTVTNKTDIPDWLQQASITNLQFANQIAEQPYQQYGGQEVAGLTPDQQAAYAAVRNNLTTGSDMIDNAAAGITGSNLTTTAQSLMNPYLADVEKPALQALSDQASRDDATRAAQAAGAGAFGGTRFGVENAIAASQTAQKAGQLSADIRSQGWDKAVSEAMGQAQTVAQLGQLGQQTLESGASALSAAGYQEQQNAQAQMTQQMQDWQDAWNYPLQQLAIREGAVTATPYGGTTTSTQPINRPNPLLTTGSGALSGAALGSSIWPGYGTAIGAVGGALLGYLGSRR